PRRVLGRLPDLPAAPRRGLAGQRAEPGVPGHRAAGRRQGAGRRQPAVVQRRRPPRPGPGPGPRPAHRADPRRGARPHPEGDRRAVRRPHRGRPRAGRRVSAPTDDRTLADLGVPAETTVVLDVGHAERVAATLDRPAPGDGDRLPSLWHWAWFTPTAPTGGLGPDGHPRLASPRLAAYPRRMWGAGAVTWDGELRVGEAATKRTAIRGVREVSGRSGDLLLVTLEHEVHQGGAVQVREEQSIVYRAQGDPVPMPEGDVATAAPAGGWREVVTPEPPLLM